MRTAEIATALAARLDGDGMIEVDRLVHPDAAKGPSDLALAMSAEAAAALERTRARAVVVLAGRPPPSGRFDAVIAVDQLRFALAKLTALFDKGPAHAAGVHATAIVADNARVAPTASIGPYTVIGERSRIGAGTVIMSHVTIGADVVIGDDGLVHAGVRIGDRVVIGDRVIIQHNAVIGSDGFSFAPDMGPREPYPPTTRLMRVHSLGNVVIGDDVEIGAATTIDRSTLQSTVIGSGTKIDNHVHIGHNVAIGRDCIICGMVGISGSVTLGERVRLGGGVGIADHVSIGTEAIVGAGSGVAADVPEPSYVAGYPAVPIEKLMQQQVFLGRHRSLQQRLESLAERVAALERQTKP